MSHDELDGLLELMDLKALPRAGWLRCGVGEPESVAAHSWGLAALVIQLLPSHMNIEKALCYAILHDLPEVRIGDITPLDGVHDKAEREARAMRQIQRRLPRPTATGALWQEYEAQRSVEARFVKQLDRLDMALQAVRYHQQGEKNMLQFVQSAATVIDDPHLVRLLERCRDRIEHLPVGVVARTT